MFTRTSLELFELYIQEEAINRSVGKMRYSFHSSALMKKICILALVLITIPSAAFSQGSPSHIDSLWFWFGDCPNAKVMGVRIIVEGQTIYRSSFRVCRMERTNANAESQRKIRAFHFSGGHTFQNTYRTAMQEEIEGNLWQAGADPDAILLGVSFTAHDQVLLNTIHIVKPGKPTQSVLDRDVVIKTYPMNIDRSVPPLKNEVTPG